jgi:hypothetical protein
MIDDRIARVETAIEAMRRGQIVIMVDDEDRENEGDLCMAAQFVTPEAINLMAKEARGLICVTLTAERCKELELPMMVTDENGSVFGRTLPSRWRRRPVSPRVLALLIEPRLFQCVATLKPVQLIWLSLGISFLCARNLVGFWFGLDRPKEASIWRACRG